MESYSVDTDPEQIIRWLMVERERGASGLQIGAVRVNERQPWGDGLDLALGDEEREDLSDQVTVAVLEISPIQAGEGWRLIVTVEDEFHPPEADGEDESEEEEIDLDTFYLEFIRPGRGTASVIAEVDSPEGEAHLDRLLEAIETNTHVPEGRPTKRRNVS